MIDILVAGGIGLAVFLAGFWAGAAAMSRGARKLRENATFLQWQLAQSEGFNRKLIEENQRMRAWKGGPQA